MMAKYQITSKCGRDMGIWDGENQLSVLISMHRDAGYGPDVVWIDDDAEDLEFADDIIPGPGASYREMCGGINDWIIKEAE